MKEILKIKGSGEYNIYYDILIGGRQYSPESLPGYEIIAKAVYGLGKLGLFTLEY